MDRGPTAEPVLSGEDGEASPLRLGTGKRAPCAVLSSVVLEAPAHGIRKEKGKKETKLF